MSTSRSNGPTRSSNEPRNEIGDAELWKKFAIDFLCIAQKFPDNKVYATIRIESESAREIIKHFVLIVNNYKRAEFESSFNNISIAGFDIKKDKTVKIQIQAIPINNQWKTKESKCCEVLFTGKVSSLSPVVSFEWSDNSVPNVHINWRHTADQSVEKYTISLDEKEIHYVYQRSFSDEIEACIHHLTPGTSHTVQIISKLRNGKEKQRSDRIHFTLPTEQDDHNMEVITVRKESVPQKLFAIIEPEKEKTILAPEPDPSRHSALDLLEKLRDQIEKRKYH